MRAVVALGANLENPEEAVELAITLLDQSTNLIARSSLYSTKPVGGPPQPDYVNAVVALRTSLSPRALLTRLQAIERRQGRDRRAATARNSARTLDLDLLLYGRRRMRGSRLTVPHPRMHERAFVLLPLVDVAPALAIPGRGLARVQCRVVRAQRIARTRSHATH